MVAKPPEAQVPKVTRKSLVHVMSESGDYFEQAVPLDSIFPEPDGDDFPLLQDAMERLAWHPSWQWGGGAAELLTVVLASNPTARQDHLAQLDLEHKCRRAFEAIEAVTTHKDYNRLVMRFHRNELNRAKIILVSTVMHMNAGAAELSGQPVSLSTLAGEE